jgi:uncharacterized protein HemX
MPPLGAALPYIIGAATVGATIYQTQQAGAAQKSAAAAAKEQQGNQMRLEQEAKDRMANQESEANAINVRDTAKRRQAGLAMGAGGRQDTILTGPLGISDEASGGKKTLLGT